MDDDTVQFIPLGYSELPRILRYAVNADENIPLNGISPSAIIKRNDIRIGIVVEVLLIDRQQVGIAAEDHTDFTRQEAFIDDGPLQPAF